MTRTRRALTSLAAATGLAFGGLVVAAPALAAPCGTSISDGWTQIVPSGTSTYTIQHRTIYYYNCSSVTVRVQPDIAWGPDLACKTVTPYATTSWIYKEQSNSVARYRSMKSC
jgi:hypothetical protein